MPLEMNLLSSGVRTPLGEITMSALLYGTRGISLKRKRVLASYVLVYLFRGRGFFYDQWNNKTEIAAGSFLLLFPEMPHAYEPPGNESWDEIYIIFKGPIFDLYRKENIWNPAQALHRLEPIPFWLSKFQNLFTDPQERSSQSVFYNFLALLGEIFPAKSEEKNISNSGWYLNQLQHQLGSNFQEEIDFPKLSQRLGVSYEKLRKDFKKETGLSPIAYRNRVKIETARKILLHTKTKISEISRLLGFYDPYHFSRSFKKETGQSPETYRADSHV